MKRLNYFMTGILLIVALCINLNSIFAKTGPTTVCYVETNGSSIESVGKYTLASTGENVFDIAIIFAANINYNTTTQKAYLHINEGATTNLGRISTLQNKGIKVSLSVLGNHQGAGICNFPDQASAQEFAQELSDVVDQYGLDGIDFDDEYSNYGTNGTGPANAYSFVYLVSALRQLQPDIIISFYYIGEAKSRQSYNGVSIGTMIDYSWNAYYGTYSAPNVPGLTNSQLGPAAVWINNTSTSTAANNATRTINEGYGVYLTYALPDTDESAYVSAFTNPLFGSDAVFGSTSGTAPSAATNPDPANATTSVSVTPTLSWTSGSGAASHNVYFGTSNPPASQGNQSGTTYTPGTLNTNTTYYWRIDEVNSYGTTTGNVWSFTTEANATTNLAPDASISVSSEYPNSNWSKEKLTDGIIGQDANGEWASDGEVTPWAQLNWSQGVTTSKVILYDRPSTAETIHSGTLTFSDGSSVSVSALPDNGEGLEVSFSERIITWVKFQVDDGNAYNNGLSEFEVIGYYGGTTPTPPVAGFSANTTSVTEGGSVNFTDNSTNTPTSWSWTFEGGTPSSSTAQNPAVTYNTPGTYNVTLTATNADGNDTETKTDYITVNAQSSGTVSNLAPDASISVSSEYPNATWSKEKLTDGISGQFGNGEWASDGEQTPWAQLNWTQSVVTSKIILYDRSVTNENISSGTLTFSDGSSVSVGALPIDGTALEVDFSERTITWVKFQVDQGEGPNNGMSEFEVFGVYTTSTSSNLAPDASITVSSEYPNATWSKEKLTDGISGQFGNGEWASDGEQTPWAQLNWSQSVVTSKIVLYDRSITNENISSGTLTFSDGSSVAVGALPVDGTALDVDFSERTITWVKFQVDQGEGANNGMSEFEVIGHYDNLKSAADKEEVNTLTAIKVYPNPVKDVFTVEFAGESITRLAIFDIQGRLVYQNEFKDRIQISTDEISGSGILFIKLANESNTYIERIVIE